VQWIAPIVAAGIERTKNTASKVALKEPSCRRAMLSRSTWTPGAHSQRRRRGADAAKVRSRLVRSDHGFKRPFCYRLECPHVAGDVSAGFGSSRCGSAAGAEVIPEFLSDSLRGFCIVEIRVTLLQLTLDSIRCALALLKGHMGERLRTIDISRSGRAVRCVSAEVGAHELARPQPISSRGGSRSIGRVA